MNNPLSDIRQLLLNNNLKNIFLDGFVVSSDALINDNQITIQSEPSSTQSFVNTRKVSFAVYNKNSDKEKAIETSRIIRNILLNFFGTVTTANYTDTKVRFHIIKVVTEPYFWGVASNNSNIYLSRYEAIINDTDIANVYY
jgi:hypothetical protein